MARQYGTDASVFQTLTTQITDTTGITVVDTTNGFGSSPMGIALREQVLFGLPNASFNLLPPDPASAIEEYNNPLPYWQIQTTKNITATPIYDSTNQTWGIKLDPGTAPTGDYLTLKTRAWVATDDNLAARQKASLTLAKNGTYAGSTQYNVSLSAEYFTYANASLGTTVIGTVYDNATFTSISGTTTTGGSAISSSAAWVEFTVKLTVTATVSSSTSVTLQSLLLATLSAATGSFVVVDTFTASGTWTRPTGVTNLIAVVGVGGGGGGGSGELVATNSNLANQAGGGTGGSSSSWAVIKDLYVGGDTTVTVGIGTAGAGGAGTTFTKAAAGTATAAIARVGGGAGGATTFGAYLTIPGGGANGTAGAAPTSTVYGLALLGAVGGTFVSAGGGGTPAAGSASAYGQLPYWQSFTAGAAGSNGTTTGASTNFSGTAGGAGSAGIIGAGGGGGRFDWNGTTMSGVNAFAGGYGGAAGGGGAAARVTGTVTVICTAGSAGTAAANSGAGGGGGGGAFVSASNSTNYNASTLTATTPSGASGAAGRLYVVYVA